MEDLDIDEIINKLPLKVRESARKILEQKKEEKLLRDRVHKHVCNLIEPVNMDDVEKVLNDLDKITWTNIIEERSISLLCGLPTCCNEIEKPRKQKYIIDFKESVIYENDAEKLKFCSDGCWKSSNVIKSQLFDQPLWLRSQKVVKNYDLSGLSK
uniref:RNA polymerase II subunit B1 CTD phosphatase RPAP2 homolog n=1 Tax=Strongyloides venezuelensis TaxID=75913 RepID=A0A0K0G3J6_STRVS